MSRVLIWKDISPDSEYDIYRHADNMSQLHSAFNATGRNFGNRLWFQGLMSELDTGENEYDFLKDGLTIDFINENYDFIICPMANIFNRNFTSGIQYFADIVNNIRIPFYVIACGVQAENYDSLDSVIEDIGDVSTRFISAVYNSGGEFALRGNFTKTFFDQLGFPTAVVTGCPSMYQNGRDFQIKRTSNECYKPIFNGNIQIISKIIKKYPESVYFDQDVFVRMLYDKNYCSEINLKFLYVFQRMYGMTAAKLLSENKVKLIPDMHDWRDFIRCGNYDYSFGSRIHGNIMAILSGVPSTVLALDSRTREMAEFFGIPCVVKNDNRPLTAKEFEEAYFNANYNEFNAKYKLNYDSFETFLRSHKIVSHINEKNKFFDIVTNNADCVTVNQEKFKKIYKRLKCYLPILKTLLLVSDLKNGK